MDEALAAIKNYAKTEYAMRMAYMTEMSADGWNAAVAAISALHARDVGIDYHRAAQVEQRFIDDYVAQAEQATERIIFQVKSYKVDGKPLYRAYVNGGERGHPADKFYDRNWFFTGVDGQLKLVGYATVCWDCRTLGSVEDSVCGACTGLGWEWMPSSPAVEFSGPPTEVRKLQPPLAPQFVEEYERE